MKKKLSLLLYGFVLINVWSICFLASGMADVYTAAMGLVFTFLSIYLLQKEYDFKLSALDKWMVMALPILYLCYLYTVLYDTGYFKVHNYNFVAWYQLLFYKHIINPVTIAFIVLLLGLTKLKDLTNPRNLFIFASITIFYAYFFMHTWKNSWVFGHQPSFDAEVTQEADGPSPEASAINVEVNLSDFSFINASLDTVTLPDGSGRYTLLETWSETCPPCIKAMRELPDFYRSIEDKVSVYYVYENRKASVRNKFDKIFTFKEIKDKSKILIDVEQHLYQTMNMRGYPYFLIFDSSGKLVHHIYGYGDKDQFKAEIVKHIQLVPAATTTE
jgi:thioredoxin-related protein